MPNVFLSYSPADERVARQIGEQLFNAGFELHLDSHGIAIGGPLTDQSKVNFQNSAFIVILLSSHSSRTGPVTQDVQSLLAGSHEKYILPVLLDSDSTSNLLWPLLAGHEHVQIDRHNDILEITRKLADRYPGRLVLAAFHDGQRDAVRNALTAVRETVKEIATTYCIAAPDYESVIARTFHESLRWAGNFQVFGMVRPGSVGLTTVNPRFVSARRRLGSPETPEVIFEEDVLASTANNLILIGDPGSGKTTALKRFVLKAAEGEAPVYVVVVRARDLRRDGSLLNAVLAAVALLAADDSSQRIDASAGRQMLSTFFSNCRTLLAVDGVDEFTGDMSSLWSELGWFGSVGRRLQVLVTCRSGAIQNVVTGFRVLETAPLAPSDVAMLADSWGLSKTELKRELVAAPYAELASRPLFLVQILIIYERYGALPTSMSDLYRLIVGMMLREWDAERAIRRSSRFSSFTAERKFSFLSTLAYHLTYRLQVKSFDVEQFLAIYSTVHGRFALPLDEGRQVLNELETHTGLLVRGPGVSYEFSHLSLQEFLTADYISREPHSGRLASYLEKSPAAVAIATSIVSDPSAFLALVLAQINDVPYSCASAFFSRLVLERPVLDPSSALGGAILLLFNSNWEAPNSRDLLAAVQTVQSINLSLKLVLTEYAEVQESGGNEGEVVLQRRFASGQRALTEPPETLRLKATVVAAIAGDGASAT